MLPLMRSIVLPDQAQSGRVSTKEILEGKGKTWQQRRAQRAALFVSEEQFRALLSGGVPLGRLDRDWAALRLLEYAPDDQIRAFLSFGDLIRDWPRWRPRIRSVNRRRGLDFVVAWVASERPDLM